MTKSTLAERTVQAQLNHAMRGRKGNPHGQIAWPTRKNRREKITSTLVSQRQRGLRDSINLCANEEVRV